MPEPWQGSSGPYFARNARALSRFDSVEYGLLEESTCGSQVRSTRADASRRHQDGTRTLRAERRCLTLLRAMSGDALQVDGKCADVVRGVYTVLVKIGEPIHEHALFPAPLVRTQHAADVLQSVAREIAQHVDKRGLLEDATVSTRPSLALRFGGASSKRSTTASSSSRVKRARTSRFEGIGRRGYTRAAPEASVRAADHARACAHGHHEPLVWFLCHRPNARGERRYRPALGPKTATRERDCPPRLRTKRYRGR